MHELSIAEAIVAAAVEEAEARGATCVMSVHLRIGALSAVVPDALAFGFEIARSGTIAASATLDVEMLPVRIHCPDCDSETELPGLGGLRCGRCNRACADVRQGRELEISALTLG
jgi:hydrogenase nickel incorporation protein HypA/HybF